MEYVRIEELYTFYLQSKKVNTDSRIKIPEALFFALSGPNFDGNAFAKEALEKGASAAVMDNKSQAEALEKAGYRIFLVENVLVALQNLAHFHRKHFDFPVIAITGSNGKTTTKELCSLVLAYQWDVMATEGNLNNHIGIPLTLLSWPTSLHMGIVEMGANHLGEIADYCKIVEPDYGLITNCGKAHLEGFGSLEGVINAKTELYDYLRENKGKVFLHQDLEYLREKAKGIEIALDYGYTNGMVQGGIVESNKNLAVELFEPFKAKVITQLIGNYNLDNVLAAITLGIYFDVPWPLIQLALAKYRPENQRSQWLETESNKVIIDAYNANPTSMKASITNMQSFPIEEVVLCLGEMKEVGEKSEKEHEDLLTFIQREKWKNVFLVGAGFKNLKNDYTYFDNVQELKKYLKEKPIKQSYVLLKGSRSTCMEELIDVL
ncbi:MAG TPA: UDP-N-acetylmuramoyl-tripeptide--D-alanyl-D-alanine ligase [Chitinophagaceae bacterium]|nr:UDP-N-acetylmuramoyl-tripeptide--D-alanyl-D-alanine ligase [Chitinophagaceae bacterium]